jgi:hypothetical protein
MEVQKQFARIGLPDARQEPMSVSNTSDQPSAAFFRNGAMGLGRKDNHPTGRAYHHPADQAQSVSLTVELLLTECRKSTDLVLGVSYILLGVVLKSDGKAYL